ncbi:hypothetical protein E3T55_19045 [Cryobacterium frigoriphilum]|uniref:DUF2892 domain-containing protein n=1 Tax=Cryobacterium frigoriphilum TaxID=1259150 RepID=A0A4R8ZTM8_9MICO|nr:hypothetical protein [Cryobacterium frigoriphilum]TFD45126.1 hypothetical protein E3T55_19045 [Cryobacterium frigoriphilum]
MIKRGEWFSFRVTRLLFSVGVMLIGSAVMRLILAFPGDVAWVLLLLGMLLVALATRGPWDSVSSGRNRSVLGFRARSGSDAADL